MSNTRNFYSTGILVIYMYQTSWPLFWGQYTEKVAGIFIYSLNLILETYENYTSSDTYMYIYIKIIVSALHC